MRYIDKTSVSRSLIDRLQQEGTKANYVNELPGLFNGLPGPLKNDLKESLIKEQGGLCCYCESELTEKCHIEHIYPKTKFPYFALNYKNMLCSCQANLEPKEPKQCGMAKGDKILKITPLNKNCLSYFRFTKDGRIFPANTNDADAQDTIEMLQLNNPCLKEKRKNVIDVINSKLEVSLRINDSANIHKIKNSIKNYCNGSSIENPHPYISAVRCCFKNIIK